MATDAKIYGKATGALQERKAASVTKINRNILLSRTTDGMTVTFGISNYCGSGHSEDMEFIYDIGDDGRLIGLELIGVIQLDRQLFQGRDDVVYEELASDSNVPARIEIENGDEQVLRFSYAANIDRVSEAKDDGIVFCCSAATLSEVHLSGTVQLPQDFCEKDRMVFGLGGL